MNFLGFVPCRAGSERVINKNTRPFAGFENGLIELKLRQLSAVPELSEIIVSSNDPVILDYAGKFAASVDPRVTALERPHEFGISATSMERFIAEYIAHLREDGVLFWTHVTQPFATPHLYREAIATFLARNAEGYDSLISATRRQTFLWRDGKPFNYDNTNEKWPRSQDLPPLWEINHAIYAIPFAVMRATGDRIGAKPFFYEMEERDSLDIDWQDQFDMLEDIFNARTRRGEHLV